MTNYGRPRYVKILDISFSDLTETYLSGENISILDYYLKKYNIKIENIKQPLLEI
jgi:hypothetical protein